MSDEQTNQRIRELRSRGLSPNQIARNLGIKTAVVSDAVRKLAAERAAISPDADQIDCLLNAGWSTGLRIDGHPEWHDPHADQSTGGLVTALITRRRRHRRGASVCVYLLDVWCLGVKNATGPHTTDERELRPLIDRVFSGYQTAPITAPIELVRDLVLGAADYARRLGFAPHPDCVPMHRTERDHLRTQRQTHLHLRPLRRLRAHHAHPEPHRRTRRVQLHGQR